MSAIKLESSDGIIFKVEYYIIKKCDAIKQMCEDLGINEGDDECVRLPNVNGRVLEKVIEWCKQHNGKSIDVQLGMVLDDWDEKFLNIDPPFLMDVICAANYLMVNDLTKIGCMKVANMIHGRKAHEINKILKIECDFTEEELMRIEQENTWLRET